MVDIDRQCIGLDPAPRRDRALDMARSEAASYPPAMGAFDTYEAPARCPSCGDINYLGGQTKAFEPDFGEHFGRHFEPGAPQVVGYVPSNMIRERIWDGEWWRVRDRAEPRRIRLLADFDELVACLCGRPLAAILNLEYDDDARTLELRSIDALDAIEDDVAAQVDLASGEGVVPWTGDYRAFVAELEALVERPEQVRAQTLRRALHQHFDGYERWSVANADEPLVGWCRLQGEVRCEACGATRERARVLSLLGSEGAEPALGAGFSGGALRVGARLAVSLDWRERDEHRGPFLRLRHPLPADSLTLCGAPERWGCGCGAGRAALIVRFAVDDGGLVLEELTTRSLHTLDDLEGVDLAYASELLHPTARPREPVTREEAIRYLSYRWRLAPSARGG